MNKATAIENGVAIKAAKSVTANEVTIIAAAPTWFLPALGFQSVENRKWKMFTLLSIKVAKPCMPTKPMIATINIPINIIAKNVNPLPHHS